MQNHQSSEDSGFTLIELLIVIIIIGILAAIAFVAYSSATNKANAAAAQSTLNEVQSKLAEYNGNNGNYPTTQASFDTWVASATGGNNASLAGVFVGPGYTYTASPASCDDSATPCTGYSATATASIAGGTAITVSN